MFYGGGYTLFFEDDSNTVVHVQPSVLSLSGESEQVDAQGVPWTPGVLQVLASAQLSSTITASLSLQKVDVADLSLILNTKFETLTSFSYPEVTQVTVPSSSPYDVTITGLTADQTVVAAVSTAGAPKFLTQIASAGTPAAGQYEVTSNTVSFHSGEAGALVTIKYMKTVSSATSLGGTGTSSAYDRMSFFGYILGTSFNAKIWIPQFTPSGSFDLGLIGSAGDDITIEGTISTPSGWNRPYWIIKA